MSPMTTLNISLPDSMRTFIDDQIAQGGYSTASEYIRDLIRQAQKQAAQEKLDSLLIEGLESGKSIEVTDRWWQEKQQRLVELRRQQG